ncbi:MAG: hypothetical protein ACRCTE_01460 [Cellulosilyticaceae bacterium]
MKKQKVINIVTWIVTVITGILWMPVFAMGIFVLEGYVAQSEAMSIGIIGGADGPTAVYASTVAFVGGISDFVILGGMLTLTIILWYIRVKLKSNREG